MAKVPNDNTPRCCVSCGETKPATDFHRQHGRKPRKRCAACVARRRDGYGKDGVYVVSAAVSAAFWSRARVGAPGECWEWTGHATKGYGALVFAGRYMRANRLSYLLRHGELPADKFVCHSCDNKNCVNPAHLFLGTPQDNTQDRDRKHRVQWGARHYRAKLSADDVYAIRESVATTADLAQRYKCSVSHIHRVRKAQNWTRLNGSGLNQHSPEGSK